MQCQTTFLFLRAAFFAALCLIPADGLGAQASVTATTPANGSHSAQAADNLSATLSAAAGTPTSSNYIIHGSMSGIRSGAYSGGGTPTLTFNPTKDFFPGEEVEVTLTDALPLQAGGTLGAPYSWRYRVAPWGGPFAGSRDFLKARPHVYTDTVEVPFYRNGIIRTGDMDGDGDIDIIHAIGESAGILLYVNDGMGNFSQMTLQLGYPALKSIDDAEVADIDGDGDLDLLYLFYDTILILFNDGTGAFDNASGTPWPSGSSIVGSQSYSATFEVADFDGDGYPDIVWGGFTFWKILSNNGDGTFTERASYDSEWGVAFAIGDIDGDGAPDIAVGDGDFVTPGTGPAIRRSRLYFNDGAGNFSAGATFGEEMRSNPGGPGDVYFFTSAVKLGDLDGDGTLDMVHLESSKTNFRYKEIRYALNNGSVDWTAPSSNITSGFLDLINTWDTEQFTEIALGDLDNDGDLDIAAACDAQSIQTIAGLNFGGENLLFVNDGMSSGALAFSLEYVWVNKESLSIALADLDGDGDLDIIDDEGTYLNGVTEALTLHAASELPAAFESVPYRHTIPAFMLYATVPVQWTVTSVLPGWLSFDTSTGTLSGTPPASSAGTTETIDITAVDDNGAGVARKASYTLPIRPTPTATLPFDADFESGTASLDAFGVDRRNNTRAQASSVAGGGFGLQLDANRSSFNNWPNAINWPLQYPNGFGKTGADSPSHWDSDAPSHVGSVAWAVNNSGNAAHLAVSFDYQITNTGLQPWYANFVFEWSDDDGATWNIASGNGALSSGVYRDATTGFVSTSFNIYGVNAAQPWLMFRVRWLTKLGKEDPFSIWIAIDNIHIDATTAPTNPVITTATLPEAVIGAAYDQTIAAVGGSGALTWSATGLPAWLTQNPSTGQLSGTPPIGTAPTTITLNLTVTDGAGNTGTKTLTIALVDVLTITTLSLPTAQVGLNYGPVTLTAAGGNAPYTWTLSAGALPINLSLSGDEISGKPAVGMQGSYPLTLTVTDTIGATESVSLTLTVDPPQPLALLTTALPDALVFSLYGVNLSTSGGIAPLFWSSSDLPLWLTLNGTTGQLSGTPPFGSQGVANFSVTVNDTSLPRQEITRAYTLTITLTPPSLGGGAAGGCALTAGQGYDGGLGNRAAWLLLALLIPVLHPLGRRIRK